MTAITDTTVTKQRHLLWLPIAIAAVCAATATLAPLPAWAMMWLIASALFFTAKAAVLHRATSSASSPGPARDLPAFTLLWPGFNWAQWTTLRQPQRTTDRDRVVRTAHAGQLNLALGLVLIFGVARHIPQPLAATWVAMVGLIFTLHCGVFTLLAAFWDWRGRSVRPLMHCPVMAASVTEFWGQRWNLGFRDLTHTLLFKPSTRRFGVAGALWLAFIASGLVHELVTSLPAGAGYGGPTLYFVLQAAAVSLERRCTIASPLFWRLRAWALLLLPLPLLFHAPFALQVMRPFFTAIHALP